VVLLVAIDAHVSDPCIGQQPQKPLDHPEPGSQHRHHGDLVAQPHAARRLQGRVDLDLPQRQPPRDLDGHDRGGLKQRLAEQPVSGLAITQDRQAIGQHRMVDHDQGLGHRAMLPGGDPDNLAGARWCA
jgi:hypothetical protein